MVSPFNLNVAPMNPEPDFRIVGPFPDSMAAGWSGPEFGWNTLQDICPVDPTAPPVLWDEYVPEWTFGYDVGYGGVPVSPCAVFNPVDAAPKLPGGTNGCWPSMPPNPNPAFCYSDGKPFLDVTHFHSHQQFGVVHHEANGNTQRAPDMALPDGHRHSRSQNPQSQFVPPHPLIPSDRPVGEETCPVSQKRKRGCKDKVCLTQTIWFDFKSPL